MLPLLLRPGRFPCSLRMIHTAIRPHDARRALGCSSRRMLAPFGAAFTRRFSVDALPEQQPREAMSYDVVIVGGGPAGLSAAIRLKQLAAEKERDVSVCVVEKGAEIGAHILSGNAFDPRALNELIPNWKEKGAPLDTPVTQDEFHVLFHRKSAMAPIPSAFSNSGNYIISLGSLCRWLGRQAEELGVEIYPGFAAAEALLDDKGSVVGIATGDMGIGKDGKPTENYTRGMELRAKHTLIAEGCRGSLSEGLIARFDLRKGRDPQTYGIGLKEVWEVPEEQHQEGLVMHTVGWPMDLKTYGGSFCYHMAPNLILVGFVIGLDYENPYLNPYEEFQRWKTHPKIRQFLEGGKCVQYGARAINEGGLQSLPKLTFPGGALIGCSAGFLNVPKIKGSHYAMKSGMLAAESVFESLQSNADSYGLEVTSYEERIKESWVYKDLYQVRNCHPAFQKWGLFGGLMYNALEGFILKGRVPWTLHHTIPDYATTGKARDYLPIEYPKPDGVLTFDLLTNLQRSGTFHNENQPSHLIVKPKLSDVPKKISYQEYAAPETRFCPAKVYEYVIQDDGSPQLVINAQNCVHCKTCSIKTPLEYIKWTVPEGGGGPNYENM